jgi:hypothetical protein
MDPKALAVNTISTICYTHHVSMTQMVRKHFLLPLPLLMSGSSLWLCKDHKSEAEVIREFIQTGLQTKQEQHTGSVGHVLRRLAEIGKQIGATGPADLSQNIDKYTYEDR